MKDKIVLITGASSGIGKEIAITTQDEGATVIWTSRNITNNNDVLHLINDKSIAIDVDVSCEESVKRALSIIRSKFSKVDVLVNCAGFVEPESLLNTTMENWNKTIAINLTGTFLINKYSVLLMKDYGGKIINIASTAGMTPRPGWSAYAAAKSGVINFSKAIAEELIPYNIKTFIICPGRTATPLRKLLAPTENPNTIMQPNKVADVVKFCINNSADVLEGQPIVVRDRF